MFGIQQGTTVLKQIHAEMGGIEKVEKLLGENEEARAYELEISDLLSGQLSNHDEDEVEDELNSLEREMRPAEDVHEPLPTVPDRMPEEREGDRESSTEKRARITSNRQEQAEPLPA